MADCTAKLEDGVLFITAGGRLDSAAAPGLIECFQAALKTYDGKDAVLDLEECEYITSACLRAVLMLRKAVPGLRITGVRSEVYEIFEMTGFTEMMTVEKALRRVSVDGCEVIGHGALGRVYRLSPDTVVKVYRPEYDLEDIRRERELARRAFVLGVPTAISLDTVRVEQQYGTLFELLKAKSLAEMLADHEITPEECAVICSGLMKQLHTTAAREEDVPAAKPWFVSLARNASRFLEKPKAQKLIALLEALEQPDTLIHGDLHIKNIMLQNGEPMLIDMDTLRRGHPILELAGLALAYYAYAVFNPGNTFDFFGVEKEIVNGLWDRVLALYLDTDDEKRVESVKDKSKLIALTVIICRESRDGIPADPRVLRSFNGHIRLLGELLGRVDSLAF